MNGCIGLSLEQATERIKTQNLTCRTLEVRCRKGAPGSEARVISERVEQDGEVLLLYSCFLTTPETV